FVFLMLMFGLLFVAIGWQIIQRRHYEGTWHASTNMFGGFISTGASSHGVKVLDSADAVSAGVGFCAFGFAFCTWASALVLSPFAGEQTQRFPRASRAFTWFSFICCVTAALGIFPLWDPRSLIFY